MAFASSQALPLRAVSFTSTCPAASPRPRPARWPRSRPAMSAQKQKNAPPVRTEPTLSEVLSQPIFSQLRAVLAASQLDASQLSGTLFAPTNAAIARLPAELLQRVLSDVQLARQLLLRHVVSERAPLRALCGNAALSSRFGGELRYSSFGGRQIRVGGLPLGAQTDLTFDGGVVHALDGVLKPPGQQWPSFAQTYTAGATTGAASAVSMSTAAAARARGATLPGTVGGRKAMGLMTQRPFWMYGAPYCAAKQEEYEPISIAQPELSSVDYQLMPPGSVIVTPDSVSAAEINPVSGMSKYIGKSKRMVSGDGLSDYSKLDD